MSQMKTPTVVARPDGEKGWTEAVVRFELPDEIVEEIREQHGDLDRDTVSDRITPVPTVDGERV